MEFKLSDYRVLEVRKELKQETIDYGVRMVGAPLEWDETMGKGIKVGVIDTGIDLNHEDLKGRIKGYVNFTTSDRNDVNDENGHGTHVAGIIAAQRNGKGVVGVAPEADLYIAKAFDKDGTAEFEAIRDSIEWMIQQDVHVINMSFSSQTSSREYQQIVQKAYDNNICLVCAAGNEGPASGGKGDTIGFPAKFQETIAVTAVDMNKKRADFSSEGADAEIAAAGKDILSCYKNNSYATLSGTSMATPIISGAAAILQAKGIRRYGRRLTPEEIRLLLHIYSEDLGSVGRDYSYGYGLFSFGRINQSDSVYSNTVPYRRSGFIRSDLFLTLVLAGIILL